MFPKVSIVVPVYNVKNYIEKCINSLINQDSFEDFEVIIVNDGSTDDSIKKITPLIQKYNNIILLNKTNGGVGQARNAGLEKARGEYVIFVDSDDWLEKNMIISMYNNAVKFDSQIVICNGKLVFENNKVEKLLSMDLDGNKIINGVEGIYYFLCRNSRIGNFLWNKLFKRELFISNSIRFPEKMDYGEDAVTVFKCIFYSKIITCIDKPYYNYLQRKNSITKKISTKELLFIENVNSISNFLKSNNKWSDYSPYFKNYMLRLLLNINGRALKNINNTEAQLLRNQVVIYLKDESIIKIMFDKYIEKKQKIKFLMFKLKLDYCIYYFKKKVEIL